MKGTPLKYTVSLDQNFQILVDDFLREFGGSLTKNGSYFKQITLQNTHWDITVDLSVKCLHTRFQETGASGHKVGIGVVYKVHAATTGDDSSKHANFKAWFCNHPANVDFYDDGALYVRRFWVNRSKTGEDITHIGRRHLSESTETEWLLHCAYSYVRHGYLIWKRPEGFIQWDGDQDEIPPFSYPPYNHNEESDRTVMNSYAEAMIAAGRVPIEGDRWL